MASFCRPLNRDSIVSSTTRLAPTELTACSRRTNRPSRSYSPVSSISLAVDVDVVDDETSLARSAPAGRSRARRRRPPARRRSPRRSSTRRARRTAARRCTRNVMPSSVLPEPGPPLTSVGRPAGSPPLVISSRPGMPVGLFRNAGRVEIGSVDVDVRAVSAMQCPRLNHKSRIDVAVRFGRSPRGGRSGRQPRRPLSQGTRLTTVAGYAWGLPLMTD